MTTRTYRHVRTALAAVSLSAVFLSGCKTPPPPPAQRADYSQVLNKYYEGRPLCLWEHAVTFPVEAADQDKSDELGLVELAKAGLLASKPAGKGLKTFTLTDDGKAAFTPDIFTPGAGNFCYGRRKIASIDAARRNSSTTELVDYHYGIPQPAAWATDAALQTAFPHIATELASNHLGEATLLDTTDGWEVSGTPANIIPIPARPKTSALAKAKSFLHLKKKPS